MGSKVLGFGEIGIDKNPFHNNKSSITINEVEIKELMLFDKTLCGNKGSLKCYIGIFLPLNIKLPQLAGYTKHFNNGDKLIYFLVADKELLKNTIKYGIRLKSYSKRNLIKNCCMAINVLVLK